MAVLLDLLSPYPILENIVSSLAIGDLFNLSKVNSAYRAALHGFQASCFDEENPVAHRDVRSALHIGSHRTTFWENLKTRSQLQCSEPHHLRGSLPSGCLICSAPVCEACIIKASFAKRNENTFQKRHRPLCSRCWYTGNQHKKHAIQLTGAKPPKSYPDQAADGKFCTCTARNGHLCLNCKTEQNDGFIGGSERCYGQDCPNGDPESKNVSMEGRVCLWCSRQLPGSRSRPESRRNYLARYLLARSISSYDRPPGDEELDEEQRMLEDDMLSRRREESQGGASLAVSHNAGEHLPEVAEHGRESETTQPAEALRSHEWPLLSTGPRNVTDLPRYEDQRFVVENTANR